MKDNDKNYKKYYIKGFILLGIGLFIILFGIIFPFIIKENDFVVWTSLVLIIIGIIILFPSFYLLNKANKFRLDYLLSNKTSEKNK